jgi:predicted small secreted protein
MKRFLPVATWLLVLASIACVTACNTVEGAGEDIEEAGDAIDDAAEDAND